MRDKSWVIDLDRRGTGGKLRTLYTFTNFRKARDIFNAMPPVPGATLWLARVGTNLSGARDCVTLECK